jgi:hypothetical protein
MGIDEFGSEMMKKPRFTKYIRQHDGQMENNMLSSDRFVG